MKDGLPKISVLFGWDKIERMSPTSPEKSIAVLTREYIKTHPSIADCLGDGLINYSALARKISKELAIKKEEAILIAARRYASEVQKKKKQENF